MPLYDSVELALHDMEQGREDAYYAQPKDERIKRPEIEMNLDTTQYSQYNEYDSVEADL